MKTLINYLTSLFFLLAVSNLFPACEEETDFPVEDEFTTEVISRSKAGNSRTGTCDCIAQLPVEELSSDELDAIIFMREEEKMARDVYRGLYEKWNATIFKNISESEQRHMDAMLCLIDRYGLTDPVKNNVPGVFTDEMLQNMYADLLEEGKANLTAALHVGATIEDLDIYDLMDALNVSDNEDVDAVFQALMDGSENHLRAFVRNLENLNSSYTPQFISTELFESIISNIDTKGTGLCNCVNGEAGPGNGKSGMRVNNTENCCNGGLRQGNASGKNGDCILLQNN